MAKITKDTTLDEILTNPKAGEILAKHHVPCLSCPMAQLEAKQLKLEEICQMYGINIKALIKDLNEIQ